MNKAVLTMLLILIFIPFCLSADGGGGMFWQQQVSEYPFAKDWDLESTDMNLHMVGGFGYGIAGDGRITGGYGYGITSEEGTPGAISGGFGGIVNGYRMFEGPLHFAVVTYAGIGGIHREAMGESPDESWFALSLEIDVEVGLPVFGWFMPVVYAGYQYMGGIFPSETDEVFQSYSPVLGIRLAFGDM